MAANTNSAAPAVVRGLPSPVQIYNSPFTFTATPSPFAHSIASTRWSSRPGLSRNCKLFLHMLTLLFSLAAAISISMPPPHGTVRGGSYLNHPEFKYSICVAIFASLYCTYQLFKGICDISFKGLLVPDKISDYVTFIFDQVFAYLLLSATVVALLGNIYVVKRRNQAPALVSACMCFAAFLAIATCSLFSGYKLCKRVVW